MGVPVSQMWTVARYVLGNKLRGVKRYPLVLMLEPLFRCNLACAGCGKIQYPADILKQHLSPAECFRAIDECGAPMLSIAGGEPLLHPQMVEIVDGMVARRKYVYLCTNALLLEKHLHKFKPSKYLSFSIHLDGPEAEHDLAVCRDGTYDIAVRSIKAALDAGFRVTTNATLFNNANPDHFHKFFDTLMELGVEGMMISPGYPYEKAPDQEHFLERSRTTQLFRRIFAKRSGAAAKKARWRFNQSPLFMEFLQGNVHLECTPWGNPTFNLFGWQKPCYLMQEGYAKSFSELLDTTDWKSYGFASGNPKCSDCMVHSGHEPTAVMETFGSWGGLWKTAKLVLLGPTRSNCDDDHEPKPRRPASVPTPHATSRDSISLPVVTVD